MEEQKKKKIVSHSQFSIWYTCPHKFFRDYILHEKTFEENLHFCFGTGIHEAIQAYLMALYRKSEQDADAVNMIDIFTNTFKREIDKKKITYKLEEFDEFIEDGKKILSEFKNPSNRVYHFPSNKYELLAIEDEIKEDILNNVTLDAKLDVVLKDKITGDIRIIDFKTATNAWTTYQKEDFTKVSQLLLYKAMYSKKYNVPLGKINVEFFILRRKLYDNCQYEQSHIQVFKPEAFQKNVIEVIQEFSKFVKSCFTEAGVHNKDGKFPKIPGKNHKNCRFCNYSKNSKCDMMPDPIDIK